MFVGVLGEPLFPTCFFTKSELHVRWYTRGVFVVLRIVIFLKVSEYRRSSSQLFYEYAALEKVH